MARIGLICPTVPSHLSSMATLGRELARRGHSPALVALPDAAPFAAAVGIEHLPFGAEVFPPGTMARVMHELGEKSAEEALRYTIGHFCQMIDVFTGSAPPVLRKAGIELMVVDQTQPSSTVAEELGVPFVTVCLALAVNAEPDVPPWMTPWPYDPTPVGRARNAQAQAMYEAAVQPVLATINKHRSRIGLPLLASTRESDSPLAVVAQQPEWFDFPRRELKPTFHYAAPFHDERKAFPAPFPWEKLDGRPVIYASLGTLQNRMIPVFETIARSCMDLDHVLVISLGNRDAAVPPLPGSPLVVPYAPQVELLKRSALAITHGGLNSVMESLAAGVPAVVIPVANDQPGNASRVRHIGAGEVVTLPELTVESLRAAVKRVLGEARYREKARELAGRLAKMNGVALATDIIEKALMTRRPGEGGYPGGTRREESP